MLSSPRGFFWTTNSPTPSTQYFVAVNLNSTSFPSSSSIFHLDLTQGTGLRASPGAVLLAPSVFFWPESAMALSPNLTLLGLNCTSDADFTTGLDSPVPETGRNFAGAGISV